MQRFLGERRSRSSDLIDFVAQLRWWNLPGSSTLKAMPERTRPRALRSAWELSGSIDGNQNIQSILTDDIRCITWDPNKHSWNLIVLVLYLVTHAVGSLCVWLSSGIFLIIRLLVRPAIRAWIQQGLNDLFFFVCMCGLTSKGRMTCVYVKLRFWPNAPMFPLIACLWFWNVLNVANPILPVIQTSLRFQDYVRIKLPISPLITVCILMSTAPWLELCCVFIPPTLPSQGHLGTFKWRR